MSRLRLARGIARSAGQGSGERSAGQGLVEFAIILPVFILLLIGMLEFGFVFEHNISLSYGTREGARVGAALASGGASVPCAVVSETPTTSAGVDPLIIAAVQRVVTSPGSLVVPSRIQSITIYKSKSDGTPYTGLVNTWEYRPGLGPIVDGKHLDFAMTSGNNFDACLRDNGSTPDSIGVGIQYRYQLQTALGSITQFFGGPFAATLPMSDRTVMALNPTD